MGNREKNDLRNAKVRSVAILNVDKYAKDQGKYPDEARRFGQHKPFENDFKTRKGKETNGSERD